MPQTYHYDEIIAQLEQAQLASHFYQQDNLIILQAPYQDDGSALNILAQHELTSEQIGLQFGLKVSESKIDFLLGITYSNQDRSYELSVASLKGEQKAFNLIYAFYNYPKAFHMVSLPLHSNYAQLSDEIEKQLFQDERFKFLNTAIKTNPSGQQIYWIKEFILQQVLEMKVRIQTSLL